MNQVIELDAYEFNEKIASDKSAIIIDVRTFQEYNSGHIPNSILLDIYQPSFPEKILELDREKNYLLYCRSGSRSYNAASFMLSNGFKNVNHLKDGILSWNKKLDL